MSNENNLTKNRQYIFPIVVGIQVCILAWMYAYSLYASDYTPDGHEEERKRIIESVEKELANSGKVRFESGTTKGAITSNFTNNQKKQGNAQIVKAKGPNSVILPMKSTTGANVDMPKNGTIPPSVKKECNQECKYWKAYDVAIQQIHKWEGIRLTAYFDVSGYSIGYGTRAKNSKEKITKEEADKRLGVIVKQLTKKVQKDFPKLHPEGQGALVSFAFNCSQGYRSVRVNGLSYHSKWCRTAGGEKLQGLINRRIEESQIIFNSINKEF